MPEFDHWGITEVSPGQWEQVKELAQKAGGVIDASIQELGGWIREHFRQGDVLTICGV